MSVETGFAGGGAKATVRGALAEAEERSEAVLAALRLLAFAALLAGFWMNDALGTDHVVMASLGGFGLLTLAQLALVSIGMFRPWVPWLFATLDVALLVHCLAVFTLVMGRPFYTALGVPGASMIFLFLANGAVRYRPFLVLYTGALFIAVWALVWWASGFGAPLSAVGGDADATAAAAGEVLRLAVIALIAVALSIAVARTRRQLIAAVAEMRLRTNLSRYFEPTLADELARAGEAARICRVRQVAVLFADVRGFTAMAEGQSADALAAFLTEYRARMAAAVTAHGGMVDKFIGDAVMAVFGVPASAGPAEDARRAVRCALAMIASVEAWNAERLARRESTVAIGIGVHFGDVLAGALGDERQRLEYTVIGDTVNVADRIERLTSTFGTPLLVSAEALAAAGGEFDDLHWEPIPEQRLRGRRRPVRLYRLAAAAVAASSSAGAVASSKSARLIGCDSGGAPPPATAPTS